MHRGLPCSDEMTDSGSTTPTSGPAPPNDSSSPEACSTTSTSSKAETTREYDRLQHDAVINMVLGDDIPWLITWVQLSFAIQFLDVFPDDLPGLPPDRDVEFVIELKPSTAPISIRAYRMSPKELLEAVSNLVLHLGDVQLSFWRRTKPWGCVLITVRWMKSLSRISTLFLVIYSLINLREWKCSRRSISDLGTIKSRFIRKIFQRLLSLSGTVCMSTWSCPLASPMHRLISCTWWTQFLSRSWIDLWLSSLMTS
jgi:hypothetical protein